jgi:hypothetical protein
MAMQEEINRVIEWCEKVKKERKVLSAIERNPFRDEIDWMRRYPLIEIDRPIETASKFNMVYDSTTKKLWYNMAGNWRWVEPEVKIQK